MYDLGDTVPLAVDVKDSAGEATNATTIALTITLPDGEDLDPAPTITNPPSTTGRYTYDFVPTQLGRHRIRWASTGPTTAFTDIVDVFGAAPGIVSLTAAKNHLRLPLTDTSTEARRLDEQLRIVVGAATRVIERVVGAVVVEQYTETWDGGRRSIVLPRSPVLSVDTVVESGTTLTADQYVLADTEILFRRFGTYSAGVFRAGLQNIAVTYTVGRRIATLNLIEAALELIRINFRPQQGGNYSAFNRPEQGQGPGQSDGTWRLGFFVPHGVMSLLVPDKDLGGYF